MLGEVMVAQDPTTVIAHGDDLLSIREMPGDTTDITVLQENLKTGDSKFPQPKTDKPRPHGCTTCGRSFARLEHLKRHERSHTKEKPFECPECSRCFARRDLLLRHQQKLHMTAAPSRPRNARRESTGATGPGTTRVRKSFSAGSTSTSMRPRANTISHIDKSALGIMNAANATVTRPAQAGHSYHPSLGSVSGVSNFETRGYSSLHAPPSSLPKLETSGISMDMGGGLRTAPVYGSFDLGLGGDTFFGGGGSTVNPAQLHFGNSPQFAHEVPNSPYNQNFNPLASVPDSLLDEENNFDWVNGFDTTLPMGTVSDSAIEESSPSAMSTESQSRTSEPMLDASAQAASPTGWQSHFPASQSLPFTMDFSSPFQELGFPASVDTISPKSLMTPIHFTDPFAPNQPVTPMSQSMLANHSQSMFPSSMVPDGESPNPFNVPFASSPLRNPIAAASPDPFSDSVSTRQSLLTSMPQSNGTLHRRPSQANSGTTYNRDISSRPTAGLNSAYSLPSTFELQRYIQAYINYFHPHLPFLHIPTLDFHNPDFTNCLRTASGHLNLSSTGIAGGVGCLILSMAAMGALYEFDMAVSKDLFESAKKMIQLYLEERRKADMSAALSRSHTSRDNPVHNTPLWLVQAMLLNVVYGHTCGDKTSADIASTHCAALVSLARAAELTHHVDPEQLPQDYLNNNKQSKSDATDGGQPDQTPPKERKDWLDWKIVEERKRTLFAIFTLSSLLVSAYNHAPTLTNSEIRLDLPCEEDLWAAESPQAWRKLGGATAGKKGSSFSSALATLLTASQRAKFASQPSHQLGSAVRVEDLPQSDLKPSTFGCLVLIHALHNYIWETRQRHMGRQWTAQETDAMQAHIEPALRSWQAAWASNPLHSLERPNPYGAGPLSADSIPLLDLAYVRLFVNLGRSKEAFWERDWNAMSDELARGAEIIQHADDGGIEPFNPRLLELMRRDSIADLGVGELNLSAQPMHERPPSQAFRPMQSKRERHLRKAAFYAADSLCMSDRLGNTFAEWTSRELPLQCAMCSFDCAQVLAEWITTVQERVGPYLGVLGRDDIDFSQVPGIMLLEEEDCKLIDKIKEILGSSETKLRREVQNPGTAPAAFSVLQRLSSAIEGGYGSKILMTTATLLDRAAVWPITKLMARSLETQATRMKERAENSVMIAN